MTEARRRYHQAMSAPWPIPKEVTPMPGCNFLRHGPSRAGEWNCCDFWQSNPNMYGNGPVRFDMSNNYPGSRCQNPRGSFSTSQADRMYMQPTTDVRGLQQSMYIPIIPSNPGGETQVTFPMTPETMGQPDITSACCVPVMPSQPGYQNLTPGIMQGPCPQLDGYQQFLNGGTQCRQAPHPGTVGGMQWPHRSRSEQMGWPCPPQTMAPPSNSPGNCFDGVPDTFPMTDGRMGYDMPQRAPMIQPPHYNPYQSQFGGSNITQQQCVDNMYTSQMELKRRRLMEAVYEGPEDRYRRLTSMYGSYGSYLLARPRPKRYLNSGEPCPMQQTSMANIPRYPNCSC